MTELKQVLVIRGPNGITYRAKTYDTVPKPRLRLENKETGFIAYVKMGNPGDPQALSAPLFIRGEKRLALLSSYTPRIGGPLYLAGAGAISIKRWEKGSTKRILHTNIYAAGRGSLYFIKQIGGNLT